ncbi:6519_t:CDS:2, partial [Cetraspora pellucida]
MPKLPKNRKYQQISLDQRKKNINEVNNKQNSIRSIATNKIINEKSYITIADLTKKLIDEYSQLE